MADTTKPATLRGPERSRSAVAPAVRLARLTTPQVVERPTVALHGDLVKVGGQLLDQAEAVRLWAELGEALGLAQRERRPVAWSHLADWLDASFRDALEVEVRENTKPRTTRLQGLALLVGEPGAELRALIRVGPFAVAHLRRRSLRSRSWSGPVAYYWPGALSLSPSQPDPAMAFTKRIVRVTRRALDGAPTVRT